MKMHLSSMKVIDESCVSIIWPFHLTLKLAALHFSWLGMYESKVALNLAVLE